MQQIKNKGFSVSQVLRGNRFNDFRYALYMWLV